MGTAAREPLIWVELVDGKRFVEEIHRLLVLAEVERVAAEGSHCSSTAFVAFTPSLFVVGGLFLDVAEKTKNVRSIYF